jgi:integrase
MPENLEIRNGIYYYRAMIDGRLHRKSTGFKAGTRDNLKSAQRRASEIEAEIRKGNLGWTKPEVPLFHLWAEHYLNAFHPGRRIERILLTRPKLRWQDRPIDTIMESEIRAYLNARKTEGAKPGTLERERVILAGLFRAAVRDKKLADNPMEEIGVIKTKPRTNVLSREHEAMLRGIIPAQWDRFLTIALGTGLRRSELMMARPMDLRDNRSMLWVRPESNKTRKDRLVPLREEVLKALDAQEKSRSGDERVPYFTCSTNTVTKLLSRWCEKLRISTVSPHALRRTFGTRCAEAGMYPKHLQQIMGHASIEITMKFYVHLEKASLVSALKGVTL